MFDWNYLSEEDMVDIILKFNVELRKIHDIYQEIIIMIRNRKFDNFIWL